ncbi:hypothetical protein J537_2118 [Acinetobacter baumannii 1437282]|nr:hypothetical protein ACINWC323_2731 [Acinetobacter sp. WC-323]EXB26387.1 hypothetical protein J537_2118 [Acinetobacter baumannii 1437282]
MSFVTFKNRIWLYNTPSGMGMLKFSNDLNSSKNLGSGSFA